MNELKNLYDWSEDEIVKALQRQAECERRGNTEQALIHTVEYRTLSMVQCRIRDTMNGKL